MSEGIGRYPQPASENFQRPYLAIVSHLLCQVVAPRQHGLVRQEGKPLAGSGLSQQVIETGWQGRLIGPIQVGPKQVVFDQPLVEPIAERPAAKGRLEHHCNPQLVEPQMRQVAGHKGGMRWRQPFGLGQLLVLRQQTQMGWTAVEHGYIEEVGRLSGETGQSAGVRGRAAKQEGCSLFCQDAPGGCWQPRAGQHLLRQDDVAERSRHSRIISRAPEQTKPCHKYRSYNAAMVTRSYSPRSILALVIGLWLTLTAAVGGPGIQQGSTVLLLQARGPLTPAMAEYLDRGLAQAEREQAEALIFQLDTPGGAVDLMNRMVQSIRASRVPVIVYIAPRGAIAGSAGTVLTLAGHAAAMAPETAIGAASPVGGGGEDLDETLETKTKEILKATARSLAARRGPAAVALAEATIDDARAASAEEALEAGMIDLVADDIDQLLAGLDGLNVELVGGQRSLQTAGAQVVVVEQTFIEQLLQALTNPTLVFLLLTIGVQAILIELSSPGGWFAGVVGVVSLALAGYGLGILPVNWFGLIFIGMAFVLFLLEIKAVAHGALAAAGVLSLIAGGLVLFNSPTTPGFLRISIGSVLTVAVATAALFVILVTFAIRAQRLPVAVGAEALVGRTATTRTPLDPSGKVMVAGELWSAVLESGEPPLEAGEQVEITGVDRLELCVRRRSI